METFALGVLVGWLSLGAFVRYYNRRLRKSVTITPPAAAVFVTETGARDNPAFQVISGDRVVYAGEEFLVAKKAFFQTVGPVKLVAGNQVVREHK